PHLAARGTFTDHGGITQPAPAPRFSVTPATIRSGPAQPGADTEDVARDWDVPELLPPPSSRPQPSTDPQRKASS
ncbi:carnitine dehydratase, partial [Streptomyces sp. Ru71]